MTIDKPFLDSLTAQAQALPRLRMNLDLRNSPEDQSQRMLNVIEPGTVMPIHRHHASSETDICVRGHFEECLYDEKGVLGESVDVRRECECDGLAVANFNSLESDFKVFLKKKSRIA